MHSCICDDGTHSRSIISIMHVRRRTTLTQPLSSGSPQVNAALTNCSRRCDDTARRGEPSLNDIFRRRVPLNEGSIHGAHCLQYSGPPQPLFEGHVKCRLPRRGGSPAMRSAEPQRVAGSRIVYDGRLESINCRWPTQRGSACML